MRRHGNENISTFTITRPQMQDIVFQGKWWLICPPPLCFINVMWLHTAAWSNHL